MPESYPKKEMDLKLEAVDTKIETTHRDIMAELGNHNKAHRAIYDEVAQVKEQITFTNGKVKKIIIALVAIGAFALGTGLENISTLLKLIV